MWNEIIYNLISNFIPHFIMDVIICQCWDFKSIYISKWGPLGYNEGRKWLLVWYAFHISKTYDSDVIISMITSHITGVSIVCSTVCSGADQWKHQSFASLAFTLASLAFTDRFPSLKASYVENVFIWWRHHALRRPYLYSQINTWTCIWTLITYISTKIEMHLFSGFLFIHRGRS